MRVDAARARTAIPIVLLGLLAGLAAPGVPVARAEDPSATVQIVVDSGETGTRLVLTHSRRLVYGVTTFEGRVELVYADPVRFQPSEGTVGDGVLERFETRGDRTLVLHTGPGYESYDDFELRNPFRLVVDLEGDRTARRPATPDRGSLAPGRRGRAVVVVDPGHGGVEHGAVGPGGVLEKDVALDVARRLRAALAGDDVTVVLTRDGDRAVDLDERTAIANHNRADLFVSIHLNASRRTDAYGAETYYLSTEATDDEARTLAGIENAAAALADDVAPELRERGLDLVLWDLAQNRYLAESAALAETVQSEMNALTGTRDRGVRQAPFRVLVGATMPAILVEVGFLTNPDEARAFEQPGYRDRVAEALARAVRRYLDDLRAQSAPAPRVESTSGQP